MASRKRRAARSLEEAIDAHDASDDVDGREDSSVGDDSSAVDEQVACISDHDDVVSVVAAVQAKVYKSPHKLYAELKKQQEELNKKAEQALSKPDVQFEQFDGDSMLKVIRMLEEVCHASYISVSSRRTAKYKDGF